jgi:hypothetical protein
MSAVRHDGSFVIDIFSKLIAIQRIKEVVKPMSGVLPPYAAIVQALLAAVRNICRTQQTVNRFRNLFTQPSLAATIRLPLGTML